jgi:hypothetical protein
VKHRIGIYVVLFFRFGFLPADFSSADLAVKDSKCSICLTWNVRGALSP